MKPRGGLAMYIAIAFGGAWAGWTVLALAKPEDPRLDWALRYTSGHFCSVAGLVAAFWSGGWHALRDLLRRAVMVPRSIWWWGFALCIPLVWGLVTIVAYAPAHDGFGTVRLERIIRLFSPTYLFWFVTGPLGEEFGWRGYLLPELQRRWSPFAASIMVGVLWGIWHYPLYYDAEFATVAGALGFVYYTVCLSLLITVMVNRTGRSLAMAILLHWSSNLIPFALREMFPDVRQAGPDYVVTGRAALSVVTAIVVGWAGRSFFQRPVAGAPSPG